MIEALAGFRETGGLAVRGKTPRLLARLHPSTLEADALWTKEDAMSQEQTGRRPSLNQMRIKRSVSPDGRIDSLSVDMPIPLEASSPTELRSKAREILAIQKAVIEEFLAQERGRATSSEKPAPKQSPHPDQDHAVPARMLAVGGMDGKYGRRLFITFQVNGRTLRVYGSQKQLADVLSVAGSPMAIDDVAEGAELNLPCRVATKSSPDGRFTQIDRVLPQART